MLEDDDAGVDALKNERVHELEDDRDASVDPEERQDEEDVVRGLRPGVGQCPLERRGVAHGPEFVPAVEIGELLFVSFAPAGHQDL